MNYIESKFSEFYSWIFIEEPEKYTESSNVGGFPSNQTDFVLEAIDALVRCTKNFTQISKTTFINCLYNWNYNSTLKLFEALRMLTHTSKMNFQTFFLMWLKNKKIITFRIELSTRGTYTLRIKDSKGKTRTRPTYKTFLNS